VRRTRRPACRRRPRRRSPRRHRRKDDVERKRIFGTDLLGHLPPDEHLVCLAAEILQDAELVFNLGAARDQDERPLHLAEKFPELGELAFEQEPGIRRQQLSDADRRGMGPVHRSECVLHEEVVVVGELLGEVRIDLEWEIKRIGRAKGEAP